MKILLILTCLILAGTDAVTTVTGYRGGSVQIKCPYTSGYETNTKYLCRGRCSVVRIKDIPVDSKSPAKDSRFSLYDDTTAKVFTVTITDLRPEDEGTYWCAIGKTWSDIYTEIQLLVKLDDPVLSTVSQSTYTTHLTSTHIMTSSVHAKSTHPTTDNTLNKVTHQKISPSTYGISGYIIIPTSAVLFAVAVIIAISCKIKCQGFGTVTRSPTGMSGVDEEKYTLPECVYQGLDPDPDQSDPIYQNVELET